MELGAHKKQIKIRDFFELSQTLICHYEHSSFIWIYFSQIDFDFSLLISIKIYSPYYSDLI